MVCTRLQLLLQQDRHVVVTVTAGCVSVKWLKLYCTWKRIKQNKLKKNNPQCSYSMYRLGISTIRVEKKVHLLVDYNNILAVSWLVWRLQPAAGRWPPWQLKSKSLHADAGSAFSIFTWHDLLCHCSTSSSYSVDINKMIWPSESNFVSLDFSNVGARTDSVSQDLTLCQCCTGFWPLSLGWNIFSIWTMIFS